MSIPDIENILIKEEDYGKKIKEEVLPYLEERKTQLSLGRSENEKLFVLEFVPDVPHGAIVISHGFTETTAKFYEMTYYFLQEGCAVYVYDHCGHGKSYRIIDDPDKVHVDSYERYVNDLLLVADTAKKEFEGLPLYLFGHSMGGGIAACAAASGEDVFDAVILSSPMIRPVTGNFPWPVTRLVCWLFNIIGKKYDYAPGQGPFTGEDRFENSACVSKPRYEYYNEIRKADPDLQMNGATYGWLYAGVKMNIFLQKKGVKKIKAPILLFQAENETFVINSQQELFIEKLKARDVNASLVFMPKTKHEIYRSHDDTMEDYLRRIFRFFEEAAKARADEEN